VREKAKAISVKLPNELHEWLIQEAERDERSKSGVIARAVREYRAKREQTPELDAIQKKGMA